MKSTEGTRSRGKKMFFMLWSEHKFELRFLCSELIKKLKIVAMKQTIIFLSFEFASFGRKFFYEIPFYI